ncbi:MAG: hypothetical protein U0R66_17555 [Mycobacterium sp.]
MDVVVYTMARKFPRLIGKFPNGQTIPFGPFTFVQIGVLIGGLMLTFITIQVLGAPKLPTAAIAAFLIVPAMAATRRLGFSMARTTSRLLWVTRPWIRRSPLPTGINSTAPAPTRSTATGSPRDIFEAD